MKVLIQNGHIVDPSQQIDGIGDIVLDGKKIQAVRLRGRKDKTQKPKRKTADKIIDATGFLVVPGLIDMHVHLREPGFEHKETIRTGTCAAIKGGFTTVCCMPNTFPINDNASVTEFIIRKASQEGCCSVFPIGAITKSQKGKELAEIGTMRNEGCIAFSDDGNPVMDSMLMRRALEYSQAFNVPIISHSQDLTLSDDGVMNEGHISAKLGLKGIPVEAEQIMIFRDILLAELTGGRLHIAHVSTEGSVSLIREAKKRGVQVTAETCPHYFSVTEKAVEGYNTNAKVNPPLRTEKDIEAIKAGLQDDTIDVIATDHAPHHIDEKLQEFDKAPFGISGLETALSLSLDLVHKSILTFSQLVEKMTINPAKILQISKGSLLPGSDADLTLIDAHREYTVSGNDFVSLGKNTPFDGWTLKGSPILTVFRGRIFE